MSDDDLREFGLHHEGRGAAATAGPNPDRTLIIREFVVACEKAGIADAMFGDADRPGIFDRKQVDILCSVRIGAVPLLALGRLAPGRENALTADQIIKAQSIMSEEASLIFAYLYKLCLEAQV